MSETAVKEVINKAIKDATYRQTLFSNPSEALQGYDLTGSEKELLSSLTEDTFNAMAGNLGDRTTKGGWVPGA